jgi:hypothetical protein
MQNRDLALIMFAVAFAGFWFGLYGALHAAIFAFGCVTGALFKRKFKISWNS